MTFYTISDLRKIISIVMSNLHWLPQMTGLPVPFGYLPIKICHLQFAVIFPMKSMQMQAIINIKSSLKH